MLSWASLCFCCSIKTRLLRMMPKCYCSGGVRTTTSKFWHWTKRMINENTMVYMHLFSTRPDCRVGQWRTQDLLQDKHQRPWNMLRNNFHLRTKFNKLYQGHSVQVIKFKSAVFLMWLKNVNSKIQLGGTLLKGTMSVYKFTKLHHLWCVLVQFLVIHAPGHPWVHPWNTFCAPATSFYSFCAHEISAKSAQLCSLATRGIHKCKH